MNMINLITSKILVLVISPIHLYQSNTNLNSQMQPLEQPASGTAPFSKKITILAMSDTHDQHHLIDPASLPPADIFIHAGDFTTNSYRGEMDRFRTFLQALPYRHKIVVAGNHDFVLEDDKYENKHKPRRHKYQKMNSLEEIKKLKEVCTYLCHEEVLVEGLRIFGSPFQPLFYNWGFQYHESRADEIWQTIPEGLDILVTHGPPKDILDDCEGLHIGCPSLAKYVKERKPKLHIFGHAHEGAGKKQIQGIRYHNVAVLNLAYEMTNKAQLIEL